jgi:hypothetical protein
MFQAINIDHHGRPRAVLIPEGWVWTGEVRQARHGEVFAFWADNAAWPGRIDQRLRRDPTIDSYPIIREVEVATGWESVTA